MKLLFIALCASLAAAAVDRRDPSPTPPSEVTTAPLPTKFGERRARYCGRKMASVLYILCTSNAEDNNYLGTSQYGDSIDAADRRTLHMRARRSGDGAAGRARRNIIEECCYSDCTIQDLMAYC